MQMTPGLRPENTTIVRRSSPLALLVALDHGEFLGHVEGDGVFEGRTPPVGFFGICRITHIVLVFRESILLDSFLDPGDELVAGLQERMQVAGVDSLNLPTADGALLYLDEFVHAATSFSPNSKISSSKLTTRSLASLIAACSNTSMRFAAMYTSSST